MADIKGITVEINGETSNFNKALKDMNSEIKSTQRELNGVNSLLKMDPGNVELLTQKEKLLTDAISETETKLSALKQAQEAMKAEGIDESSAEYRNLQREIASTEQKLDKLTEQQKEFGSVSKQQLEAAGQSVQDYGSKVEAAGKELSKLSAVAAGGLTAAAGLAYKAGLAADDINTLSKTTGIATDEIQKFNYASDLMDVSFDTVAGSVKKLTNNMQSAQEGSATMAGTFETLGVSVTNADGSLRNSTDVFYDVIDALGQIENTTERDALAMDVFGKSATDLNPLIIAGADAFREMGDQAEEMGLIMSQDTLDAANAFNDAIDSIKAEAGGTFMALGAEIAEMLLPALQQIGDVISSVLEWIRGLDEDTLAFIGTILAIVAAVGPLVTVTGKVISFVGSIISFIPKLMSGINMVINVVKILWAIVAANPIGAIITVIGLVVAALVALYNSNEEFRQKVDEIFKAIKDTVVGVFDAIISIFTEDIPAAIDTMITAIKELPAKIFNTLNSALQTVNDFVISFASAGADLVVGLWNGFNDKVIWILDKIKGFGNAILSGIKSIFGIHSPSKEMAWIGDMMAQGLGEGFEDSMRTVKKGMIADMPTAGDLAIGFPGASAQAVGSATGNITINLTHELDGRQLARTMYTYNRDEGLRRGSRLVTV